MSKVRAPQTLDLLGVALSGRHLIEASAGTGKTYAISQLYLRLVVEARLGVDRILVVTFTNAATEELRGRIAKRLREARDWLDGLAAGDDALLKAVLSRLDAEAARTLLEDAITHMDEAAIHTIHGFCQRLLSENAFESGAAFAPEMITDETPLRRRAIEDFWRREVSMADAETADWALGEWRNGPSGLLAALAPHLGQPGLSVLPDAAAPDEELGALMDWYTGLQALWRQQREEIIAVLTESKALNQRSYSPAQVASKAAALDELLARPGLPRKLDKPLEAFRQDVIEGRTKKGKQAPTHGFFAQCAAIEPDALERHARRRRAAFLAAARAAVLADLAEFKRLGALYYYDDLLGHTATALDGEQGPALAAAVRQRWPRALIDEFQDTDPVQYRIVEGVYGEADAENGLGLYLIGDPKQAIYAFRGADIFTYMAARRGDLLIHGLDTNWRSASRLVRAVNRVFERVERPFLFDDIPFASVKSGPKADAEPLRIGGKVARAPLRIRWLPPSDELLVRRGAGKGQRMVVDGVREAAADDCARAIELLLVQAGAGEARIGQKALAANDIAVLVRSHREAALIRRKLGERGVSSIGVGRETVFDSFQAFELDVLLAALEPGARGPALRALLSTSLMGQTAADIARLDEDERGWDTLILRLDAYRKQLRERGFLAAFLELLRNEGASERLRRLPDGERRLTNLLHLAELATAAERAWPGAAGLRRWLALQRSEDSDSEERLLRLESDASLVRILTLHKSKGLEFPVVFLPFPWSSARAPDANSPLLFHDRDDLGARLDLGSDQRDAHVALKREEDLAEDLRLFYVALTRAKHLCVMHWAAVSGLEESAPAYLLHRERRDGDADSLHRDLDALVSDAKGTIAVEDVLGQSLSLPPLAKSPPDLLQARSFSGRIDRDWRLWSYSGLAGHGQGDAERPDYDARTPPDASAEESETHIDEPIAPRFLFPRGTRPGQCLHEMFEHLDFTSDDRDARRRLVEETLDRYAIAASWAAPVSDWVGEVLATPLTTNGPRLQDLTRAQRIDEMEFHFALDADPADLAAALAEPGEPPLSLPPDGLRGLMKGFIDLVFEHGGRYHLLDYKSNHLGDRLADYGPSAVAQAMHAHRYHLQHRIYALALHRWLGQRLRDYDPSHHLGRVHYLFLRGMSPRLGPAGGQFSEPMDAERLIALDRAFASLGTIT